MPHIPLPCDWWHTSQPSLSIKSLKALGLCRSMFTVILAKDLECQEVRGGGGATAPLLSMALKLWCEILVFKSCFIQTISVCGDESLDTIELQSNNAYGQVGYFTWWHHLTPIPYDSHVCRPRPILKLIQHYNKSYVLICNLTWHMSR